MEYIIRDAMKEDAQAIIDYVNEVAGETDNLTFGKNKFNMSLIEEEEYLTHTIAHPDNQYLLAIIDNQIVGSLNFNVGHRERTAHAGEFGISILKEHWKKGIGRALIEMLINRSVDNGRIRKLNLRVRTDNSRAIGLYESLGFKIEGHITREFLIDGIFYDTFHMGLEL